MIKTCITCGFTKRHYAKGLCRSCYHKQFIPKHWSKNFDCCVKCETTKSPHIGKGLCRSCYDMQETKILCACGCGLPVNKRGNKISKFIHGHWLRTQKPTDEFWIKARESTKGTNNFCLGKFGKDHPAFGHYTTDATRELRRRNRIKCLSERKTTPTDIEIILSNILDKLKIIHHPQHPINNKFVVDEFVERENLIIEAFGGYWHGDTRRFPKDKLDKRQKSQIRKDGSKIKYLTKCGYKILILWEMDLKKRPDWCEEQIILSIEN